MTIDNDQCVRDLSLQLIQCLDNNCKKDEYKKLFEVVSAGAKVKKAHAAFLLDPDSHFAELQRCLQRGEAVEKLSVEDEGWEKSLVGDCKVVEEVSRNS